MIDIEKIIIYFGFILGSVEDIGDYDIVIIKFKWLVVFYKLVYFICLFEMEICFVIGKICFVIGWGR